MMMPRGKICHLILLQLIVSLHFTVTVGSQEDYIPDRNVCTFDTIPRVFTNSGKVVGFEWPSSCRVFYGELDLPAFDLSRANFSRLEYVIGRVVMIGTDQRRFPAMPNLREIRAMSDRPGLVILNNEELRDMRALVNWQKDLKILYTEMPVFISGNPNLETVNYPKMFHTPYSPLSCEKRLTPNYDVTFAEAQSLAVALSILVLMMTIFVYPMSMGDVNIYFVPEYHSTY